MSKTNSHEKPLLPKNNQRRLISTLYVIEKRLDEIKNMLERKDEAIIYRLTDLPAESEKNKILSEIKRVKSELEKLKVKYDLDPRSDSYSRTANSYISSGIIDLTDILSKGMRGYGKFPEGDGLENYDRDIIQLRNVLRDFPL
jgi:hypothetical protein